MHAGQLRAGHLRVLHLAVVGGRHEGVHVLHSDGHLVRRRGFPVGRMVENLQFQSGSQRRCFHLHLAD